MTTKAVAGRANASEFESRAMVEAVGQFAARELRERSLALDAGDHTASRECWSQIRELGLDRAMVGEQWGGPSVVSHDLLAMVEELATGDAGIALCVLLNNVAFGIASRPQQRLILDADRVVLVPSPLGDSSDEQTFSVELDEQLARVNGSRSCVLAALGADAIVFETTSDGAAAVAVVAATSKGATITADRSQMGLRAAPAASLELRDAEAELGDGESATLDSQTARSLLYLGVASIARGISRRAHMIALDYAQTRRQGGVPIIEHGAVRDMLGAMAARHARPLPAEPKASAALAAKVAETDAAVETTCDAVQIMGGAGYMRESGLEKLMRDAKYCQLYPQANWVARDVIAAD